MKKHKFKSKEKVKVIGTISQFKKIGISAKFARKYKNKLVTVTPNGHWDSNSPSYLISSLENNNLRFDVPESLLKSIKNEKRK